MKKIDQDIYVGIFLFIVGSFFFYNSYDLRDNTARFPKIILIAFLVLALLSIISGIIKTKKNNSEEKEKKDIKIPLLVFVFITLYVVLLDFIGFIIATLIFIPGVMLFYRNKKILQYAGCTLGTILFIYLLFNTVLKLQLP